MAQPKLARGSLIDNARQQWPGIYKAVQDIIGDGGTIIPILDPDERTAPTTFTSRAHHASGLDAAVFTYTEAPTAFDIPADLSDPDKYQGIIPFLTLNGTDEEIITPDNAYWSRDDAAEEDMCIGAWVNMTDLAASYGVMNKVNITTGSQFAEWTFIIRGSSGALQLSLYDNSQATTNWRMVQIGDDGVVIGQWAFVVAVYEPSATQAITDIDLYINGVVASGYSGGAKEAAYAGMEDTVTVVSIGTLDEDASGAKSGFFKGKMAGGPLSPFFTTKALTAAEVKELFRIGRQALAL